MARTTRTTWAPAATVLLAAIAAAACGKATITADEACSDLATVGCMKQATCTNGFGTGRVYGDMTTCLARQKESCLNALAAPAQGNSPALVEKCVADYATYSCSDFGDNNPPADCAPVGARALDGACTFNGQCASGFCAKTKDTVCGTCAPAPAAGDSCAASNCGHDEICVTDTSGSLCQIRGTLNSTCSNANPCGTGLSCVGSTATASGTCQNALTTVGAACGGTMPGCDNNIGLHCDGPAGTGKTCMTTALVGDGMPCGTMGDGSFVQCQQGDCYTATGLITGGQQGTCKADASDGAACDTNLGPGCTPPARCITTSGTTAGTCTIPLGSTCG